MSKYIVLALVAISAGLYIRHQSNEVAKAMYVEGCKDTTIKLNQRGETQLAVFIGSFCNARKQALDAYYE